MTCACIYIYICLHIHMLCDVYYVIYIYIIVCHKYVIDMYFYDYILDEYVCFNRFALLYNVFTFFILYFHYMLCWLYMSFILTTRLFTVFEYFT